MAFDRCRQRFGRQVGKTPRDQVLHHHAGLHHEHQEEHEECALALVAGKRQQQQRRHMAQAVHAHRDTPLQLGIALEEMVRIIGQRTHHRKGDEHIDRNEHREQVESRRADQQELDRQHHEKGQDQAAMVAAPCRRKRDEFAQREERDQRKQQRRHAFAERPADPENHHHAPGGGQQAPEMLQFALPGFIACSGLAHVKADQQGHGADDGEHAKDDQEQGCDLLGRREAAQEMVHRKRFTRRAGPARRRGHGPGKGGAPHRLRA